MSSRLIAFEGDGRSFLMLDFSLASNGEQERAALVRVDAGTGERSVLGEGETVRCRGRVARPRRCAPEAFATEYLRRDWRAWARTRKPTWTSSTANLPAISVSSRAATTTRAGLSWSKGQRYRRDPICLTAQARPGGDLTSLFSHRPELQQAALQPMTPVEIEARDGLSLVSYLTLPGGTDANGDARPEKALPLVLLPHDGPWQRDSYAFNAMHQWLANRGYAVLSVNFRGSSGLGKSLLNAGNRQWGGAIQQDVLDAAQWAVTQRIAELITSLSLARGSAATPRSRRSLSLIGSAAGQASPVPPICSRC